MIGAASVAAASVLVLALGWGVRPRPRRTPESSDAVSLHPGFVHRFARRRPSAAPLADYLAAVAREVRGGGTVTAAFVAVTAHHPAAGALRPACHAVAEGTPLVDALRTVRSARTGDDAGLELVVHTLSCAATVGGSAAATLDAAASVLRERDAVAADARAHSAQARLSGRVLTIVPLAFAAWSVVTDGRIRRTYTSTPIGAACVAAGLLLNLAGWWWMRRIVVAGGGR